MNMVPVVSSKTMLVGVCKSSAIPRPASCQDLSKETTDGGLQAVWQPAGICRRTQEYKQWVEAYSRKLKIPMQWAEKGGRKEDFVRLHMKKLEQQNRFGVYFIFLSMEQGETFRFAISHQRSRLPDSEQIRSRFTHMRPNEIFFSHTLFRPLHWDLQFA